MKIGLTFFPTVGPAEKPAPEYYDECLSLAELADELGYHHVKTVEHYFFTYGGYSPDPVTFLAAVAARTTRIRVGTSAVIPAFTHPVKLAGKLAMLDNLSHGRLDVAFGRAFLPDEFEAFGVPLDESRERFDEGVAACKLLWTEENVRWRGRFHAFGPVTLLPRPFQRPHPPVYVTSARSLESCAAAGRAGHRLQLVPGILTVEQMQESLRVYRQAWSAAGHDPAGAGVHLGYPCYVAEEAEEAYRIGRHDDACNGRAIGAAVRSWGRVSSAAYPNYEKLADATQRAGFDQKLAENKILAGTPDDVVKQLVTVAEWFGDDVVISLNIHSGHLAKEAAARTLRLVAEHVTPSLPGA
ncbi:LLM class flavin-dependent oxidoreductase [Micromonospora sp. KC721]|uniref:LLM class flavin-dependent oxidoreductase n=1 Tax=Micromonospora sp. KC721 TaxID=2530380 RepID=UPI0010537D70|nr:LLM class flavin-dependent oxidoreductase [Micromonospora sp. KC721]TDB80615.1 LLM class flavin-dependent oxidoreductase [Micromonospora sp. KC721]